MKKTSKTSKKKSPFTKPSREIDGDSYELLMALERGEKFERVENYEEVRKMAIEAAKNYFKKSARVSLRISEVDLLNAKRMAAKEGLPYQTFLTSMIHKITTGQLIPKPWG